MSPSLLSVLDFSDVYADACVRSESGEIIFLSLYGREAGLHQLTAAFHLPASAGGISQLRVASPQADPTKPPQVHIAHVGDARRLEKTTTKFPKGNLFGSLTHMWIYDPLVRTVDRASRSAWLLFEPTQGAEEIASRTWETVCDIASVPLMAHWRSEILQALEDTDCIKTMLTHPPLGAIVARFVTLPDDFQTRLTAMIKAGKIGREPSYNNIALPVASTANTITARVVAEKDRLKFLPRYFGKLMMQVENSVYDWLTQLSQDYDGGLWDFVELTNGGCYMVPPDDTYAMESPNGASIRLNRDAVGICTMLFALSHLSMKHSDSEPLANCYHAVREFALEHPDQHAILALID
jgi:hypothetical protein